MPHKRLYALPLYSAAVALAFGLLTVSPDPSFAAKGQKVGSSKANPNQRTKAQVKKALKQNIKRQNVKIQNLERTLANHKDTMKIIAPFGNNKREWQVVNKTINAHHAARKELTRLTTTTYTNYAAQNGWSMVPNPPRTAPPPLPPAQLGVPAAKESLKQPKAKAPPRGR